MKLESHGEVMKERSQSVSVIVGVWSLPLRLFLLQNVGLYLR